MEFGVVVHAEMEQDIRDAYQIFANEWTYTGDAVGGVKYIRGNIGCPYDCREGDGYSLLAAALMGDKTSFDGLWMCVHDKARVKQPRYIDGVVLEPGYAYGDYALKDNANSATDEGASARYPSDEAGRVDGARTRAINIGGVGEADNSEGVVCVRLEAGDVAVAMCDEGIGALNIEEEWSIGVGRSPLKADRCGSDVGGLEFHHVVGTAIEMNLIMDGEAAIDNRPICIEPKARTARG